MLQKESVRMLSHVLCRYWCVLWACSPLAAAQTSLEWAAQWEAVYKTGALAERHLQLASQFERALVIDNVTVETLLVFVQALETPKTASSKDARTFELNLKWKHELGAVQACWEQEGVRFPEASAKDENERSLCLGADVDLNPLTLKIAFDDIFEQFSATPTKDRAQQTTTLEGVLDLGEVRLDERAQLRRIRFPLDAKKAQINALFETNLDWSLWGTAIALLRRDRIEGFPNDAKKDKQQTLLQIEAQRAFAAWELDARWQQELERFPLDPVKHKRASALKLEGTLSSGALDLSAAWAQEHTAFERDPVRDTLAWAGEIKAEWSVGTPTLEVAVETTSKRFPHDPAKHQDERIFNAEAKWEFDALGPFYPKRFSLDMRAQSKHLPLSPKKDELRWAWTCQLRLILLKEITLDFTVSFEDRWFSNDPAKPATSRSAFEFEFAADF